METKKISGEEEEKIKEIRSVLGKDLPETDILRALWLAGNNTSEAINVLLDAQKSMTPSVIVKKTVTSTGARVSTEIKQEISEVSAEDDLNKPKVQVKEEESSMSFDKKVVLVKEEPMEFELNQSQPLVLVKKEEGSSNLDFDKKKVLVKEEVEDLEINRCQALVPINEPKYMLSDDYSIVSIDSTKTNTHSSPYNRPSKPYDRPSKPINVKPKKEEQIDDGDFPEEPEWLLVGRSTVVGLSTCKRKKLDFNEIVYFEFPSNPKTKIVRFSTKRSGEIGRLPIEWTKCIIPLVNSSRVKFYGRCVTASTELRLMQEIHLYISFYIHYSVFTEGDNSSWSLTPPSYLESIVHPLPTLLKLLKMKPFKQAEFTPEELNSHKRKLNLHGDSDVLLPLVSVAKRTKGSQQFSEPNKDEQTISESTLNKLVGAAEVYNLEEMDPPSTLTCVLHPYQKQALHWMSKTEEGMDVERAAQNLHPCWEVYHITDKRTSEVYINIFSGEATAEFPSSTQMTRGGILADAMGLGKTVMTIALILARPGRGIPDNQEIIKYDPEQVKRKYRNSQATYSSRVKGGTLIVCPMALLGQWKDELETHSEPGTLQVYVQYGVDRTTTPYALAEHDVVLTTYGVLAAAYKSGLEESIFHKVDWFRVVLDEAHTIKSSRTQGAQAAFALSSHCRWCLTGTPLQNSLEDLYSLLCFLHVEPWCNWAWWQKLIQRPYENGDERGLRLVKAILRALMLRRTKDTKDKKGSPILVLPPADIQTIECEQSDAERDFYGALFKRSKIQFDQFVAQGKVLHNYASILELLLRLRQCCNHPFLVLSRGDSQKYADLNQLARQFLETNSNSDGGRQTVPTRAYVEEVVEGIRRGDNTECPICLESADDPVLTPCAHKMCRECLLSSWTTSSGGPCPICRQQLRKNDLITCPSDNPFRVDIDNNWRESCKVANLLDCLETLQKSGSGEKSIIFSQWTSFFDLLEIPLSRKGIGFLRFDGKLSQKNREKVLKEFNETNKKMVLLMSLKAGGVGLNLTAASNVFLMDPWWNPAVEEQAIMRIHRIGQKRVVSVRRFIVKDTVEERLQQVQARKQRMIAGALTDEEVRSARIEELKMLFR
ncbi:SNF2-related [Macleaya cordata]|uniref:SNF2-related n=1 Tax=Macleaya cordata TaxID=56857 RepID=A0A200QTY5_MACCD|nr:SNF2-related [Macleaya cordata]